MNEKKQKKIRTQLINFMNQEIIKNKKKSNFLINSMTLEQLEEKNMQCKDFYIEEKDQIYQNIDNGWIIGLNIYINNASNNNPFIYFLSNEIRDNYILSDIKNKKNINIKLNTIKNINNNKEAIIQKQSNKILYILKEGHMGSPVDTSLLIKKGLGDRKLKRKGREFNSIKMPTNYSNILFNKDNIKKQNEIEIGKKIDNNLINSIDRINEKEENHILTRQLSNETLETEISRIIKQCHDYKYENSFEHFPSDSKITEISREINCAKMYAKKLKYYCRTLKRKFTIKNENNIKQDNKLNEIIINNNDLHDIHAAQGGMEEIDENKNIILKKDFNNRSKKKNILNKKASSNLNIKKNIVKTKEENNKIDIIKNIPKKKIKSEKDIKLKIKRESFLKILKELENEKNNNHNDYRTLDSKKSKKKTNILKLSKKFRKSIEKEYKSKPKIKIKKDLKKSPLKLIKNKEHKEKRLSKNQKTMKNIPELNDSHELSISYLNKKKKKKEKVVDPNKKVNHETIKEKDPKKLIKSLLHKIKNKNKNKKRGSVDTNINLSGFEKLNFLNIKTKSTRDQFLYNNRKKKKKSSKINYINTNNTSMSQQKDSSPSVDKNKKYNKKIKKKNNNNQNTRNCKDKKKKTFGFLKARKGGIVLEAIKKIEKRKTSFFQDVNAFNSKNKIYSLYNEDKKEKNIIINGNKKSEKDATKLKYKVNEDIKQFNNNENYNDNNRETDIFNIMDEFLYKRKHERRK